MDGADQKGSQSFAKHVTGCRRIAHARALVLPLETVAIAEPQQRAWEKLNSTPSDRVHDFVRSSNGRPRSEACVFARPQPRELVVCSLAHPRRKTQYPHRDPGHFVPAVIKLNCYRSCGTSALAQPALPVLPRHTPSLRADLS